VNINDIDESLQIGYSTSSVASTVDLCTFAGAVYTTLSALASRANWWQAPVLRTAAGLVNRWQKERC
jgi:hypothetical protein